MSLNNLLKSAVSIRSNNLAELIGDTSSLVKEEVSEERIIQNIDKVVKVISFYREYPDIFIDDIKGPNSGFKFRFTQRLFCGQL